MVYLLYESYDWMVVEGDLFWVYYIIFCCVVGFLVFELFNCLIMLFDMFVYVDKFLEWVGDLEIWVRN